MRYWTKLLRILIIVEATSGSNCDLEKYREWFDDLFVNKTGTAKNEGRSPSRSKSIENHKPAEEKLMIMRMLRCVWTQ